MTTKTWRFTALDTLFFKESRPMGSLGDSEMQSLFPPPSRTVMGAIRSAIGEHNQLDWQDYQERIPTDETSLKLKQEMGDSQGYGKMKLTGLFLAIKKQTDDWQRLYPVPANLVATKEKGQLKALHFLKVGLPMHCDLGKNVCMAETTVQGVKPLTDYWITEAGLKQVLSAKLPDINVDLIKAQDLYSEESRLGIGRNNVTRGVSKSLLYQTKHIRPNRTYSPNENEHVDINVAIEADIKGLSDDIYPDQGIVRLGGEGRGGLFNIVDKTAKLEKQMPEVNVDSVYGITLTLLSPLYSAVSGEYCPLPGFEKHKAENATVWKGKVNNIALTLHCIMADKAIREGGWDLANKKPRPVQNFTPAGSVFYCTIDDANKSIDEALNHLHHYQIEQSAEHIPLGRGIIAAGLWLTEHKK